MSLSPVVSTIDYLNFPPRQRTINLFFIEPELKTGSLLFFLWKIYITLKLFCFLLFCFCLFVFVFNVRWHVWSTRLFNDVQVSQLSEKSCLACNTSQSLGCKSFNHGQTKHSAAECNVGKSSTQMLWAGVSQLQPILRIGLLHDS